MRYDGRFTQKETLFYIINWFGLHFFVKVSFVFYEEMNFGVVYLILVSKGTQEFS